MNNTTRSEEARKRNAEYNKEYRKRQKLNVVDPITLEEKRKLERERKKAYRAKKKTPDMSPAQTQEHTAAITPTEISSTANNIQFNATTENSIICEPPQPSTSTGLAYPVNETSKRDDVNASSHGNTPKTRTYRYSDETVTRIAQTAWDIKHNKDVRGNTLHEILERVNERNKDELQWRWSSAADKFNKLFSSNEFGSVCSVCDRLCFASDVKRVDETHVPTLLRCFPGQDVRSWVACSNCYRYLKTGKLALMCK